MHTEPSLLERWHKGDPSVLNVAAFCPATRALGPFQRAAVWVQGCAFRCRGCLAVEYQPFTPAHLMRVEDLAARILQNPFIDGLTISGGEPLQQAPALSHLIALLKTHRPDFTFISYTGYVLETLRHHTTLAGVEDYLNQLDVLIDGPYRRELDNGQRGLKGSANQTVHHLTPRLHDFDFENAPRQPEIQVENEQIMFVGIPTPKFLVGFNRAVRQAKQVSFRLVQDVRS